MEADKEPRGNEAMGEGPPDRSPPEASRMEVAPELAASEAEGACVRMAPPPALAHQARPRPQLAGQGQAEAEVIRDTVLSCWSFSKPVDPRSTSYCLTLAPEREGSDLPSRPCAGGRVSRAV